MKKGRVIYSKDIIDGFCTIFSTAPVADTCDQILDKMIFLPLEIKSRINDKKIVDPTVTIYEDITDEKLSPQHALSTIDESASGSIIVTTGNPSLETVVVWGGLITAGTVANKHEAAVLNGGVRGLAEIRHDYDFPVYAKTVTPGTTPGRFETISANQSVTTDDVTVNPEDLIVGGIDGMVCTPQAVTAGVLTLTQSVDNCELEQVELIIQSGSLREGLTRYGQI